MTDSAPIKRALEHAPVLFPRDAHGELLIGGQRLSVLAERVGQTPFYAYDRGLLKARVAELRGALPQGIELHYAMKANPMPALVQLMAGLVDGIDVASAISSWARPSRPACWSTWNRCASWPRWRAPPSAWACRPASRCASTRTSS
jgi:hypothetical protein